jgi:hypothetical protein
MKEREREGTAAVRGGVEEKEIKNKLNCTFSTNFSSSPLLYVCVCVTKCKREEECRER